MADRVVDEVTDMLVDMKVDKVADEVVGQLTTRWPTLRLSRWLTRSPTWWWT